MSVSARTGCWPMRAPGISSVDCSTVPLALTRELAAAFAEKGAAYVDAPVAGHLPDGCGPERISRHGRGRKMTHSPGWRRCWTAWPETVLHCGGSGSGTVTKLLLNTVLAQSVTALAEALLLGRRAGVDGSRLFEALRPRLRQLRAPPARHDGIAARLLSRRQVSDTLHAEGPRLRYGAEGVALGMTLAGMETAHGLLERTVAAGVRRRLLALRSSMRSTRADSSRDGCHAGQRPLRPALCRGRRCVRRELPRRAAKSARRPPSS